MDPQEHRHTFVNLQHALLGDLGHPLGRGLQLLQGPSQLRCQLDLVLQEGEGRGSKHSSGQHRTLVCM